jgi:chemotaxis protein CheD
MKPFDYDIKQITLVQGDLFFDTPPVIAHTLLGSCVAFTLWHPPTGQGGMCHYLLAHRESYEKNEHHQVGYYATDAIKFFIDKIKSHKLLPSDFEVKMFGGGNMLEAIHNKVNVTNVANNNIHEGRLLLENAGFNVQVEDVGGVRYRTIYFDLTTGDVWVQYGKQSKIISELSDH